MKKNYLLASVLALLLSFSFVFDPLNKFNYLNFIILFLIFGLILIYGIPKLEKIVIDKKNKKIKWWEYLTYSLIIIIPLVISFIAYYPGVFVYDSANQWFQAQGNVYNNWHPVMHTIIFFKLPSLIYNNSMSVTIFQELFIFIITLYFAYFLRKNYLSFKGTVIFLLLMVLNPLFIRFSIYILKDTPYSYCLFLITLFLINIVKSDGEWLKSLYHKILFLFVSLGIILLRHNGIIPCFLIFTSLLLFMPKIRKPIFLMFLITFGSFWVITHPIYNFFNIDSKNGGRTEMIGIPLNQISYYYNNYVSFSDDELFVLNEFSPLINWEENYNPRNFNFIKYTSTDVVGKLEKYFNDVLRIWITKSLKNPKMFVRSYLNVTSSIWKEYYKFPEVDYEMIDYSREVSPKGEMASISNIVNEKVVDYNNIVNNSPLRWLFSGFGLSLWLIILSMCLLIKKCKWHLKYLIPYVPVLINTMVIMLLITGEEYRFVYSQVLCMLPLLVYSLSYFNIKKEEKPKLEKWFNKLFVVKTNNTLIQFFRYIFVGGIAAVVNIGMLYIFTEVFKIYYLISNVLAFTLGLLVNYILSKKFVFQEEKQIKKEKEFIIYAIIGIIGLGIDTLLVGLLTSNIGIYYMLSKIISTIIVFIWNFGARKVLYKIIK